MLAALMTLSLMAAVPQDPPLQGPPSQDPPPTRVDDVVVAGRRQTVEEAAVAFVQEIGGAARWQTRARWEEPVCIGVANLRADVAQAFVDHVALVALQAGVVVDDPGCKANILIIFASDADDVARSMVEHDRNDFLFYEEEGASLGKAALEEFMTTDRPVRWWMVKQAEGIPLAVMSRIWSTTRNDLKRAIIIVDVTRTAGVDPTSLADYIALVALAQIDPETDGAGFPSILSLFSPSPTSRTMTEWDRNYLTALYEAPVGQRLPLFQDQHIARRMVHRIEDGADTP